jgi:hypothetical protein
MFEQDETFNLVPAADSMALTDAAQNAIGG